MAENIAVENSILGLMILNQDVLTTDLFTNTEGIYYSKIFQKPANHTWYQLKWLDNQSPDTVNNTNIDVRLRTGNALPFVSPITKINYTLDAFNALVQASDHNVIDEKLYKWQISRSTLGGSNAGPLTYDQGQARIQTTTSANTELINEMGTSLNTARLSNNNRIIKEYTIPNPGPYVITLPATVVPASVFVYQFEKSNNNAIAANQYYVESSDSGVTITFDPTNAGQTVTVKYIINNDQAWNYWSLPFLHTPAYVSNNVSDDYIQFRIDLRSLDHVSKIEMYRFTISSLLRQDAS